jgi:hypothetical protein
MSGQGWSYGPLDLSLDDLKSPPSPTGAVTSGTTPQPSPTGVAASGAPPSPNLLDQKKWLFDQRFKYGVDLFKFHADQRMKMFQFFLVFVGLFAGAYATLLTKGYLLASTVLGMLASILTVGFLFLEHRNEELVHIAEDVLASLESDALFVGYKRPIRSKRRSWIGWMRAKDLTPRPIGIFRREAADIYGEYRDQTSEKEKCEKEGRSHFEHGRWLPMIEILILVMFIFLAALPCIPSSVTICDKPIPLKVETEK